MARKSVQGGYCNYPDYGGCALTASDCDDPINFRSSREMQGAPVMAHGGSCRWADSVEGSVLGMCFDDGLPTRCASNPLACAIDDFSAFEDLGSKNSTDLFDTDSWIKGVPQCTVEATAFGRCGNGKCAWSYDQCEHEGSWDPFDDDCTCENVRVGGCGRDKGNGETDIFCAINEGACDSGQEWIAPQDVLGVAGYECYLCREETPTVVQPPVGRPSWTENSDTYVTNVGGSTSMGWVAGDSDFRGSGGSNTLTIVIVVVTLGALIALFIVSLVAWQAFRSKRDLRSKADAKPPPPVIQIAAGNVDEGFCSTKQTDIMDDASVLSDGS